VYNLEGWIPEHSFQSSERCQNLAPTDRAVFSFLKQKSQATKQGFFLNTDALNELLNILKISRPVTNLKNQKEFTFSKTQPEQKLAMKENRPGTFVLNLVLSLGDKVINLADSHVLGEQEGWLLHQNIFYQIPSAPFLRYFQEMPQSQISTEEMIAFVFNHLDKLSKDFKVEMPKQWSDLKAQKLSPTPVLTLEADNRNLIGHLEFNYEDAGTVSATLPDLYFRGKKAGLWIERKKDIEQSFIRQLSHYGFEFVAGKPPTDPRWVMQDEKILQFLSKELPKLVKRWKVLANKNLMRFRLSKSKLTSQVRMKSGTNWFEVSPTYVAGDTVLTHDEIRRILGQGKKYVVLKDGSNAEIPLAMFQKNEKIIKELGIVGGKNASENRAGLFHLAHAAQEFESAELDAALTNTLEKIQNFQKMAEAPLSDSAKKWLRPYQKQGVNWLHFLQHFNFGGILADDMGLGKTFQALFFIEQLKSPKPVLVICPTSVVWNWQSEINKVVPHFKTVIWSGANREKLFGKLKNATVILTTYTLLRRDIEKLSQLEYSYVVLDEAQNIKNALSQTAKAAKRLNCENRLALTGTPIENHLSELWSIFDFLMPGFLGTQNDFHESYLNPIERMQNETAAKSLRKKIAPFILRRLKKQVLKELPPKNEMVATCEMTEEQEQLYREILDVTRKDLFQKINRDGIQKSQINILSALLRLRQICCHPQLIDQKNITLSSGKFELFKETVSEILEEKHRVLVFSQFVEMLKIIKAWAIEEKIPFSYLDGSTKNRQEIIDAFQKETKASLFLLSLKAGGTGLNLTNADYVIHYDPWWNPAVEDQATDRAHRMGQKNKVFVYKMITKGSVEEKIYALQQRKRGLSDAVIQADKTFGKAITKEDLEDLFSF
jgi:non-specific serine/threonine protein kinase